MTANHANSADAVREALLPCPFCGEPPMIGAWTAAVNKGRPDATAIVCASSLADCSPNPTVTAFTCAEAIAAWNKRPSLAALAGAAPDGVMVPREWLKDLRWKCDKLRRDGHRCDFRVTTEAISESIGAMLANAPHAPAKAREVVIDDAMIERATEAWYTLPLQTRDPDRFRIVLTAALATFAEGD